MKGDGLDLLSRNGYTLLSRSAVLQENFCHCQFQAVPAFHFATQNPQLEQEFAIVQFSCAWRHYGTKLMNKNAALAKGGTIGNKS